MAESYGSDVVSVLAWLAPQTETIKLGAAIMQVPARPPAAAAMAGAHDRRALRRPLHLRLRAVGPAGLRGLVRRRVRKALGPDPRVRRGRPRDHRPRGARSSTRASTTRCRSRAGATGQGKALKLNFHPLRNEIPVFVGAIGRKSVEMAAEVCDGWIPIFFSADAFEDDLGRAPRGRLREGRAHRADLEVSPAVQVAIDGDLDAARGIVKAGLLLYLGGMGSRKTNFYVDLTHRFGFGEVADEVQGLYLDGKREEAYNAIPDELVDATSLIGTEDEVAERIEQFRRRRRRPADRLAGAHRTRGERLHTIERLAALVGAGAPA